jgi:hypothetical protein
VRRNRKDSKVTWIVFQLLQAGPRPGMTVKCVEEWSLIGVCESYRAASENSRSGPGRFLELQGRSLRGTMCAGKDARGNELPDRNRDRRYVTGPQDEASAKELQPSPSKPEGWKDNTQGGKTFRG